jgi:catalase
MTENPHDRPLPENVVDGLPIVDHEIVETAPGFGTVAPPGITHPSRGDWKNRGLEAFQEVFPEVNLEEACQRSFPCPMPRFGTLARAELDGMIALARAAFSYKALTVGRRGTHLSGVGARGTVHVVENPVFPEHDFFIPGRSFQARFRHANASFADDAGCVVRGASLKFADSDFDSPFDLPMNSGGTAAFFSLRSFVQFVKARKACHPDRGDWQAQKEMMRNPAVYLGTVDAVRDAPDSYTNVSYYSKVVFPFRAKDGVTRFCKFRMLRPDLQLESGLPDYDRQLRIWDQSRNPDDDRPVDYLRSEFKARLAREKVTYLLQMQLRDANETDTDEIFNCNRWWNEEAYPWLDVATVELAEAMEDEEMEPMRMWLGHMPPSLGLLRAHSVDDYRSVVWARLHVYRASQTARAAHNRLAEPRSFKGNPYL